jgi:hypothetical protein
MTFVVLIFLAISSSSCQSKMARFQPEEGSKFRITFTYPAEWQWITPPDSSLRMYTGDDPMSIDNGMWVNILVIESEDPSTQVQFTVELMDLTARGVGGYLLEDHIEQIDGHEARWFTYRVNMFDKYAVKVSPYISENVLLLSDDHYYWIWLDVPETVRDGIYHTQFIDLIHSIEFLP